MIGRQQECRPGIDDDCCLDAWIMRGGFAWKLAVLELRADGQGTQIGSRAARMAFAEVGIAAYDDEAGLPADRKAE
jgi:hypothetical protein